jgi:uncharacterized membrane protein (UPF0136 family)
MKSTGQAHLAYAVGAAVALGGLAGYARAKSVPSLIAGITFGAGFAACGSAISSGRFLEGHAGASTLGGILAASMGYRAVTKGKFMPAGAVAGLGAASCAYHTMKLREWL